MPTRTETDIEDARAELEQILAAPTAPSAEDLRTRNLLIAGAVFAAVLGAEIAGVGALVGFDRLWAFVTFQTGIFQLNDVLTWIEIPLYLALLFLPLAIARFVHGRLERPPLPF